MYYHNNWGNIAYIIYNKYKDLKDITTNSSRVKDVDISIKFDIHI